MLDEPLATDVAAATGVVFAALPNAVLVGPLTHVTLFVNAATNETLAGVPLPEPKYRYLISCLPSASEQPTPSSLGTEAGRAEAESGALDRQDALQAARREAVHDTSVDAKELMTLAKQRAASFMARQPKPIEQRPRLAPSTTALSSAESLSETSSRRTSRGHGDATREQAEYVTAMARKVLGASQLWSCAIAGDTLVTPAVLMTLERMAEVRAAAPQSVFYIYSSTGRNRASALALLYLVRGCHYSLQAATAALPLSTPALPYLLALIREDEQQDEEPKKVFDAAAYLPAYFARRYPHVALTAIRTALDAFPQDYATVDRVLHQHHLLHSTRTLSPSAAALLATTGSGAGETSQKTPTEAERNSRSGAANTSAAAASLTTTGETVLSSPSSLSASISGALSTHSAETPVALSTSSRAILAGGNKDGAATNALDEEAVATLCKALSLAQVGTAYEEVKESYMRHHRRTQLVLREFLTQRPTARGGERTAVAPSLPPLPSSTTAAAVRGAAQGVLSDHSRSPTPHAPGTSA